MEQLNQPETVFKIGDRVVLKHDRIFWMTIAHIKPNSRYECYFGSLGGPAGVYHANELEHSSDQ